MDPALNPEAPCVQCGAPTVRGVNSDFCSERCEEAWWLAHPEQAEAALMMERDAAGRENIDNLHRAVMEDPGDRCTILCTLEDGHAGPCKE